MKRLFMAVILLVITAPTFAHSIRYTVEGTYINRGSPENLLIPVEGNFTGWFEFDPSKSSYHSHNYGNDYYRDGFTFKFYIEGFRLFSKVSDYMYDPNKELKAENLRDINGYNVDFYPWSDPDWYRGAEVFNLWIKSPTEIQFQINSPPCCEDRYFDLSGIGRITRTEVFVPEPSSAILLAFSFLLILVRKKMAKN